MSDRFAKIPSGAQVQPTPYQVSIADDKVDELKQLVKLGRVGPPTYESTQKEHNYGVSHQWLTDAKAAWINFDWRAAEKHINSYNHWTVPIKDEKGDFTIHFTGLFSSKADAVPVVMLHGWPGSFLEFLKILSILKERYTPETLPYHVIVPSLPGYAFSDKPPLDKEFGIRDVSRIVNSLMVQLGFGGGYIAQGGDIGSRISRVLAATYDECKAAHLNFCLMSEPATAQGEVSDAEKKGLERAKDFDKLGTAYALMHATRPSTIGLILSSSPLALLAWVASLLQSFHTANASTQIIPVHMITRSGRSASHWVTAGSRLSLLLFLAAAAVQNSTVTPYNASQFRSPRSKSLTNMSLPNPSDRCRADPRPLPDNPEGAHDTPSAAADREKMERAGIGDRRG
ncbi:hypothetical protein H9Q72_013449 [Fusarium xylarioides]|uniref:Epoxide hydrolase N-terminal domain-containing protein n=1 Tax=Fusarium xylarioides TaxID=221167 RepID=A0A9P7HFM3_9HYPO|nr:hypothetical protein H9Q72_013449 [Fusarium xylarioides]